MKNSSHPISLEHRYQQGFILYMAMAIISVLSLAALIALTSAKLEAKTSNNNFHTTRALYHAEAGVKLVELEVERRLRNGETLSTILNGLSIAPPNGIEFETIDTFEVIVPERLFSFECVGTSQEARASVVVQYRRKPIISIGLFGDLSFGAQNHTSIYGFDSRVVVNPSPSDNNGGASLGSNGSITLGNNNFTFDGSILLGETGSGLIASCTRCDSNDYTKLQIGAVDPDPLGLVTGGSMSTIFNQAITTNDNANSNGIVQNNTIDLSSRDEVTLESGDYYLTSLYIGPNSTLHIDTSDGPVRIFLDGSFRMQPNTSTLVTDTGNPQDFQIFSKSTEEIRIQPRGDITAFIYAPLADIQLQPQGNFIGNIWADSIQVQPQGDIYVDTSIADQWLMNNLEIHAWYEQQGF
jgi:hypothetical protein